MSTGKILTGIIAGAAVGAILGILFAPDKGSITREKIAKKTSDTANDIKEKFDQLKDDLASKFEAGKEEVEQAHDKLKNKAEEFKRAEKTNIVN